MERGRPRKPASERKTPILFARVDPEMNQAFKRYCAEVHREAPSVVMRGIVRDTLRAAGYLPTPVTVPAPRRK